MVLESLFNPFVVKKKPWEMFFAGVLFTFVGLSLSYLVFQEVSGLLTVFLIVLAALPIIYTTIRREEEISSKYAFEWKILKEHSKVLSFLLFLFLGVTVALVIAYVVLPQQAVSTIFELQEKAIVSVNNNVQGDVVRSGFFWRIFANNLKVLFFCVVFSMLYGTGALFILTWNASVIAAAIGNLLKSKLAQAASLAGFASISSYFSVVSFSFFRYMTHGVLEIGAYFIAGIAGSILSISIVRGSIHNEKVLIDVVDLLVISLALLLAAGLVEVYVTPAFFA